MKSNIDKYNNRPIRNSIYSINYETWRDTWKPVNTKIKYNMVQCNKCKAYYPVTSDGTYDHHC